MNPASAQRDALKPPSPDGNRKGLLLALVIHGALVIALAFGVNWRSSEPEGVEAELWAAVPQVAAPRAAAPEPPQPTPAPPPPAPPPPAPPPPPVPDAQIAIEKAKQEKERQKKLAEQKAAEQKAAEQKAAEQKRAQEERERQRLAKLEADRLKREEERRNEQLAAQREANLQRIIGEAGATGTQPTGRAAQTAGPSAEYGGRIRARIRPNILLTEPIDGNPQAEVEVRAAPDGKIISRKLTKSSGIARWDEAVLRAIDRTEVLPQDTNGTVPSPMLLVFRPADF